MKPSDSMITDGCCPGVKVDKNPKMDSSVCSSVKYPRMKESMEITCLQPSGNLAVEYGGFSSGISTCEGMNVWKIMNLLGKYRPMYILVRASMDKGTCLGSG